MKHGNSTKSYSILRGHDFKVMATAKGYEIAKNLQKLYENQFPENKFILTDKNQNQHVDRRKRTRI